MSEDLEVTPEDFVIRGTSGGRWEALTGDDETLGVFNDNESALTVIANAMIESGQPSKLFWEEDGEYEHLEGFDPVRFLRRPSRERRPTSPEGRRQYEARHDAPGHAPSRRRRGKTRHMNAQSLRRAAAGAREHLEEMGSALAAMIRETQEAS